MANVTNAQAVAFSNNRARRMADLLYSAYLTAKSLVSEWNAQNVSDVVPNTSDLLVDGSALDGRAPVTGAQVTNIVTRCQELIADYEAGGSAKLNTVVAVKVNGTAEF
jgi:hypothetical protein